MRGFTSNSFMAEQAKAQQANLEALQKKDEERMRQLREELQNGQIQCREHCAKRARTS